MMKKQPKIGPNSQRFALGSLDGRGAVARRLKRIQRELSDALGGEAELSPQKRMLIANIAQRALRCEMLWQQIVEGRAASESERRYNWFLNGLRRDLAAIGLERHPAAPPSLNEYLASKGAAA